MRQSVTNRIRAVAHGNAVRLLRQMVDLTIADVARELQCSVAYVSAIELGRYGASPEKRRDLEAAIGAPPMAIDLICDADPESAKDMEAIGRLIVHLLREEA